MKTFHDGKVMLHAGDCLDVLKAVPENSIDAVVTDPPYHLTSIVKQFANAKPNSEIYAATSKSAYMSRGFMGKQWDGGDIAFTVELWAEVLRVLKPGGHMVCFGGTRTYHRMTCAIEDAGFNVRDAIMWHYGSGFPKSHDVSKGIDKAAGVEFSARPASGVGFMKPDGPNGYNVTKNQLSRVGASTDAARQWQGYGTALKPATEIICLARKPLSESTVAANVLRWRTGALNIDGCRIGIAEEERTIIDSRSGAGFGTIQCEHAGREEGEKFKSHTAGRWPANLCHDGSPEVLAGFPNLGRTSGQETMGKPRERGNGWGDTFDGQHFGDSGSAARFFYTAKADADDRLNSKHPTVKPVDLMQWLVRLVCPKGATVLDPFAGTGTTGAASFIEGRLCVLIEREAEYLADIERRMELLLSGPDERSRKLTRPEPAESLPLFGVA